MLASGYVIQLCSPLKGFNTLRSVEESLAISLESHKHSFGSRGHTIDERYVDGVTLTYGSPRQHIWTFVRQVRIIMIADVPVLTHHVPIPHHHSLVMTTSVRLVCHQVNDGAVLFSMLMIPCGMVKVVVQLAHAAHSTILHGFVNNYCSQLLLIWKSDCAQLIMHRLKYSGRAD